jgi:signal transduction histidine kinase
VLPEPGPWDPAREKRQLLVYTKLYVFALALIAVLLITGQSILTGSVRENDQFSEQIEGLRRFETRVTSIFRSAEVVGHSFDLGAQQRHFPLLQQLLVLLEEDLRWMQNTSGTLMSQWDQDPRTMALILSVQERGHELRSHGQDIVAHLETTSPTTSLHGACHETMKGEASLLTSIARLETHLRQTLEMQRSFFHRRAAVITSFIILLLVAEAFLVFRPAGERILRITDRLMEASQTNQQITKRLQALTGELSVRNEELETSLHKIHTMHHALLAQSGPAAFGTVARGIAGQLEHPIRDLRSNLNTSLELSAELDRTVRSGAGRIPLRILDELQTISSELAMRLSGQMARIESMEHLITVARSFQPDRLLESDSSSARPTIAGRRSALHLSALFDEAVALFRAGGAELDPPLEFLAKGSFMDLPPPEIIVDLEEDLVALLPRQLFITSLMELMSNAARSTRMRQIYGPAPEGYHRLIGLSAVADLTNADGVVVRVMDNGVGMNAEIRQRALEPFFSTKPGGLGMGLTHVHDFIVHGLGGEIRLGDTPGGGLTIRLHIPPRK